MWKCNEKFFLSSVDQQLKRESSLPNSEIICHLIAEDAGMAWDVGEPHSYTTTARSDLNVTAKKCFLNLYITFLWLMLALDKS